MDSSVLNLYFNFRGTLMYYIGVNNTKAKNKKIKKYFK